MENRHTAAGVSVRTAVWIVLAVFALVLFCSVCHIGCCPFHGASDGDCPVCLAISRYYPLLRLAGYLGSAALLMRMLHLTGESALISPRGSPRSITPVKRCDKLLN